MDYLYWYKRYEWKGRPHIDVNGLNYECRPELWRETKKHIVLKIPGRKCWINRMVGRQYTSPEFVIYEKEDDKIRMMKIIGYNRGGLAKAKLQVVEFLAYEK